MCENDKHLVTLYNVIFSNMRDILFTFELYLLLAQEGSNVPLKLNYWETYMSDQINTEKRRAKTSFWITWDRYNMK